ncbi:hypothetical protein DWV16_08325 [Anaerotruncus sp. AF02-27]|nr:hypothetical protein DWV16_08325 [Anaerotruncus sp. AF02-27]
MTGVKERVFAVKKRIFQLAVIFLISSLLCCSAAALDVQVKDAYSTGELVVIAVSSEQQIDPQDVSIQITKPNGATVDVSPRQERWNSANECFETYTIDLMGDYKIVVKDAASGQTAEAAFTSRMFTSASIIFMLVAVGIFILCFVFSAKQRKKHSDAMREGG